MREPLEIDGDVRVEAHPQLRDEHAHGKADDQTGQRDEQTFQHELKEDVRAERSFRSPQSDLPPPLPAGE